MGGRKSGVAIVQYSEFQCPYCATFARDTMPILARQYFKTGQVLFAFRHLPLEQSHPVALRAAVAADCSNRQGRFWEAHDHLFANQKRLADLLTPGFQLPGVDGTALAACLPDPGVEAKIRHEAATARSLGISGTPTFLIGRLEPDGRVRVTKIIPGAQPLSIFVEAIEELLGGLP